MFVLLMYVLPYFAALTPPGIDISLIKEAERRASEDGHAPLKNGVRSRSTARVEYWPEVS